MFGVVFCFLWDKFKLKRDKVLFVEIVNILIALDFKGVKVMEELKYVIENINGMTFESEDIIEFAERENNIKGAYKLTEKDLRKMPSGYFDDLRCKLSEYFCDKLNGDYNELLIRCDLKANTFQKILNFKGKNNITYKTLAKFAIGLGLTLEETKELFALRGFALNEKNKADYILICEIVNKGNLIDYADDMKEYCKQNIISDEG